MKKISRNQDVCIGCRLCEVYCIVAHSKSKDIIKAFKYETPRQKSRVLVEERKPYSFAIQCQHCEQPFCVYSCLTGAMYKDDDGRVLHNKDKCIGCWTCIMVCPYGAIKIDSDKKIISKCDLCIEHSEPYCVKNCPNEALELVEGEF
ncbi:MAG: 4Fe-4S dicluster domain-containing protein [candidate division WOR-3 bacterium]